MTPKRLITVDSERWLEQDDGRTAFAVVHAEVEVWTDDEGVVQAKLLEATFVEDGGEAGNLTQREKTHLEDEAVDRWCTLYKCRNPDCYHESRGAALTLTSGSKALREFCSVCFKAYQLGRYEREAA